MHRRRAGTGAGFTLIELLVVIAIIAILAAVLFPVFMTAKARGAQSACNANLRQFGQALSMYIDDYNNRLPNASFGRWWTLYFGAASSPGPYITDVMKKYVKNNDIWFCPAIHRDRPMWPLWSRTLSYNDNGASYQWFEALYVPGGAGATVSLRGVSASKILHPIRQPVFCDVPYGYNTPAQGRANTPIVHGKGINAAFLDGHTKWVDVDYNYWMDHSYDGLKP